MSWGEREQDGGKEQDERMEQDAEMLFSLSEQGGTPGAPYKVLKWDAVDWDLGLQSAPGMVWVWGFPSWLHQGGRHREELEGGQEPAPWRWLEKHREV